MEELAAEMQNYLEERPIKARRYSHFYVASKFIRRNWSQMIAAVILIVAIASDLTGTILYARRAEREKQLGVKRLKTLRLTCPGFGAN